jgi:hypothetical protein
MKKYYYSDGIDKFGPVSFDELKQKNITNDTLIWFQGLDKWTPAKNLEEIKPILDLVLSPITILEKEPEPLEKESNSIQPTPKKKKNYILPIVIILILLVVSYLYYSTPTYETSIDDVNISEEYLEEGEILITNPPPASLSQPNTTQYQREIKALEKYRFLTRVSNVEKIRRFLKAEDDSDWEMLAYLFSNNVERYWNLDYPTFDRLYTTYQFNWSNTNYRRNEILDIEKISENNYKVSTNFHFSTKSDPNRKERYSELLFKFDDDGFIKYTNEYLANLEGTTYYTDNYYIEKIKSLYNLLPLTVSKIEREEYYEILDEYYYYYASELNRFYNNLGKITPVEIFNEQIKYNEHYPTRNLQVSNFRVVNNNPAYTKLVFKSNYSLVNKSGKTFSGTTNEVIVFNSAGKIIEHYNEN